mmetsp:Transcript_3027/g.10112  ORF Transcript_3027/g.10112 Transcript_3027/m.10112 type:complete len:314 (+) Transcript_3027:342-1283(+)
MRSSAIASYSSSWSSASSGPESALTAGVAASPPRSEPPHASKSATSCARQVSTTCSVRSTCARASTSLSKASRYACLVALRRVRQRYSSSSITSTGSPSADVDLSAPPPERCCRFRSSKSLHSPIVRVAALTSWDSCRTTTRFSRSPFLPSASAMASSLPGPALKESYAWSRELPAVAPRLDAPSAPRDGSAAGGDDGGFVALAATTVMPSLGRASAGASPTAKPVAESSPTSTTSGAGVSKVALRMTAGSSAGPASAAAAPHLGHSHWLLAALRWSSPSRMSCLKMAKASLIWRSDLGSSLASGPPATNPWI